MGIPDLQQDPTNNKKTALNDTEAKRLLKQFDIALVPERFVRRQTEVIAAARDMGFPVVVKGVGANLLHKTDRGLVHLNLFDPQSVEKAVQAIANEAEVELSLEDFDRISRATPHLGDLRPFDPFDDRRGDDGHRLAPRSRL